MFAPKKLWSLIGNHVFQAPSLTMADPLFWAAAVVTFGWTVATTP